MRRRHRIGIYSLANAEGSLPAWRDLKTLRALLSRPLIPSKTVVTAHESAHHARMENFQDGFGTDRTLSLWRDGRITLEVRMTRIGATTHADLLFVATSDHVSPMNLAVVAKLSDEA